jgi:3-hydroxyisobutyrate dehydrogenase
VTSVGFIGLGDQGGPMARRVIESGMPTTLWARRPATLDPFRDSGAAFAATPAEMAAASDVIGICVFDDDAVHEVLTKEDGALAGIRPGSVILVHSTVHPDTCVRLAGLAAERGATLLDAPVSGGGHMAAAGQLVVMVGGDAADVERVRPVLGTFGDPVLHLGPLGSGQLAKALNNLMFTAHLGTAATVFELASALGVESAPLAQAIAKGSGRSYGFDITAGMGFSPAPLGDHAGPLLRKDVGIVAELAAGTSTSADVLFDAADVALEIMRHPRTPRQ